MDKKKLPLRFSILKLLSKTEGGLTPDQVYLALHDTYEGEKQCEIDTIDGHLMSMRGVGLVDDTRADYDDDGRLVTTYTITEYGMSKVAQYIS